MREDPDTPKKMTNFMPNVDGSLTMVFTPEQFESYRQSMYDYANFPQYFDVNSIKEVIYEDNMLTEITVLVDSALYQQNGFERQMCHSLRAIEAEIYQVLSGTPSDKWHTTITIKDVDAGEVISKTFFPNAHMYEAV